MRRLRPSGSFRGSFSFPRSVWERTGAMLRVAFVPVVGAAAERPDVRSHAEGETAGEEVVEDADGS